MWVLAFPCTSRHAALLCIILMLSSEYAASLPSGRYGHRLLEEEALLQKQAAVAAVGVPDYQAAALAEFASSLDADPYGSLPTWTGESHPCGDASNNFKRWPGVVCNAPTGYVTAIELPNKVLSGTLPRSLSVLKSLRTLDLSNNSFYGTMPTTWSNLTALATLKLSMNQLTGPLPDTFSACESMQSIELNFNQLTGSLPGSWAGMNLLEMLDLSNNYLNGTLPNAWSRMEFLSVLDLHNNKLSGTLPTAWLKNLLQMNLGANKFEGVLPAEWAGDMASLRGVNIAENNISGSLPDEWSKMKSLQTLSVSNNQITGSVPATWGTLHALYNVNITSNSGICGDVPASVSGVLGDTNLTSITRKCPWEMDADNLLAFKAALQDPNGVLDTWKAGSNPCPEGALPWNGVGCSEGLVMMVILPDCNLKGPLPDAIGRLTQLKAIHLGHNLLSGTLPADWGVAASSLIAINLTANQLTGPLPSSWGEMTSLQHLDLSKNQLEGPLPSAWSQMVNLATLLLGLNRKLNGTLPESWSGLSALEKAHLDSTSIKGPLPASWAKLTRMQQLGLANNLLTGAIPMEWGSITGTVDVTGNQLMCGANLPNTVNLQKGHTDLGKNCNKGDTGLSLKQAVAVGICSSFAGAALLAGTAFLIVRSRQAATSGQTAALRASAAAGQMARPTTPPTPGPAANVGLPAPPCSPALSAFCRPAVSAVSPAAAAVAALAIMHPPQHRLASTTTAASPSRGSSESPTPPTPRSPAGPVGSATEAEQQRSPLLSHPLANLRHNSAPGSSSPGRGASPLSTRLFASSSSTAHGLAAISAARFTAPNTPIDSGSSSPVRPAGNSASISAGTSTAATAAETAGTSASAPLPAITFLPVDLTSMTVTTDEVVGNRSGEHTPRNTVQSMPGSPGAWGSAVKTCDLDHASGASRTPEHGSMRLESLRARMERLLGREAAAEAAEATAAAVQTEAETTGVAETEQTTEEQEAAALAAVDPVEAPEEAAAVADGPPQTAAEGTEGGESDVGAGSPIAQGSRGMSGFTALVWPQSPRGTVAEGPGVSPRGVAALMAAGVGGPAAPQQPAEN